MKEILSEILKGKSTCIKNINFLKTADYVQPFLDRLKDRKPEYIINVKLADQMSLTEHQPDIIYNRVHIQAVLPDTILNNEFNRVMGMVYGLDTRKPVAKFYTGYVKDGKFYNFDATNIKSQMIENDSALDFDPISELLQTTDNNITMLTQLKNTTYSTPNTLVENLGEWLDKSLSLSFPTDMGITKLSSALVIDAYKNLVKDKDSTHYVGDKSQISFFQVYDTFADLIKNDKDIINTFEKTILVNKLLNL